MSEHNMTFLGADPTMRAEWRVRCSCGWTEKTGSNYTLPGVDSYAEEKLRNLWDRHAYTQEELELLHELSDCKACIR